jgi:hypothetical protein
VKDRSDLKALESTQGPDPRSWDPFTQARLQFEIRTRLLGHQTTFAQEYKDVLKLFDSTLQAHATAVD